MNELIQEKIDLGELAVKGDFLIKGLKNVAKEPYLEKRIGKDEYLLAGQRSSNPAGQLIVMPENQMIINLEEVYQYIIIREHSWPGMAFPFGFYGREDVAKAIRNFSKSLHREILKLIISSLEK